MVGGVVDMVREEIELIPAMRNEYRNMRPTNTKQKERIITDSTLPPFGAYSCLKVAKSMLISSSETRKP